MLRSSLCKAALLSVLALAAAVLSPSTAEARRGVMLITTGNTIKHVGEVADGMRSVVRSVTGTSTDYKVGYLHERIGVFWIDLWTWGGEYILYDDSEQDLWSLDEEETATLMGTTTDKLDKPIFYTFPPGLLALGVIGGVCACMQSFAGKQQAATDQQVEELLSDPRYERALEHVLKHHHQKELAAAEGNSSAQAFEDDAVVFDQAVRQLVDQGVPQNDAYCNLNLLLEAAYAHSA